MGKTTYSITNMKRVNYNACPNLYSFDTKKGLLGLGGSTQYFCSATDRDLDSGYVYSCCLTSNKKFTSCSAWNGNIYPHRRKVPN